MTKPYPTIEEVSERVGHYPGAWDCVDPSEIIKHTCDLDRERREAPAAVESIRWADHPDIRCVVAEPNGLVFGIAGSDDRPKLTEEGWRKAGEGYWVTMHGARIPGPWQESLRARPEGV